MGSERFGGNLPFGQTIRVLGSISSFCGVETASFVIGCEATGCLVRQNGRT